jgi:hypothetical protein
MPRVHFMAVLILGFAGADRAYGAPHILPCDVPDEYSKRTHQLVREAYDSPLELLIIKYAGISLSNGNEIAIGLSLGDSESHLIRFEFEPSLWFSSSREVKQDTFAADFQNTEVKISTTSVPVSNSIGTALKGALRGLGVGTENDEEMPLITLDATTYELTFADGRCVKEKSPLGDAGASHFVTFSQDLAKSILSWSPESHGDFELKIMRQLESLASAR